MIANRAVIQNEVFCCSMFFSWLFYSNGFLREDDDDKNCSNFIKNKMFVH